MKNLIRKAIFLAALTVFPAMLCLAQTKVTVTGLVLDNEGEPLIGVSVIESGTSNGVATGLDGTFSIMTNEGASLDFSYVGFEPQTLKPGRNRDLRVIMTSENDLDAVVVVGYGTIDKRSLTNSVSKISDEEFISGTSSPLMAVQGKIPGLSIISTNGADPNSGVSLQLRGINSVNGDQGPLVVIDGVPGAELELVAKEDIESITVLKDASAAAIYGTRASGGVVLITTKQPDKGRLTVNFSTELQLETLAKKPDLLSADEFREYGRTGTNNVYDFGGSTDWYDAVTRDAPFSQRYALSASGGTENFRVSASGYMRDAAGIAIKNDRQEFGGRLSTWFKFLDDRLELSATVNYTNVDWTNADNSMFEYASSLNPTYPVYDETSESGYYMILNQPYFKNPVAEVELRDNTNSSSLLLANYLESLFIKNNFSPALFDMPVSESHFPVTKRPGRKNVQLCFHGSVALKLPAVFPIRQLPAVPAIFLITCRKQLIVSIFVILVITDYGIVFRIKAQLNAWIEQPSLDGSRIHIKLCFFERDRQVRLFAGSILPMYQVLASGIRQRMVGRAVGRLSPDPNQMIISIFTQSGALHIGIPLSTTIGQRFVQQAFPASGFHIIYIINFRAVTASAGTVMEQKLALG